MKLSGTITIRPLGWVLLDIGALLLVVGGLFTVYAIQSGAWNPMGSVVMPIWPFLLATLWVAIGSAVALLMGFQLAAVEAHEAEAHVAAAPATATATALPSDGRDDLAPTEPARVAKVEEAELAVVGR
jgi:hypothetical protein